MRKSFLFATVGLALGALCGLPGVAAGQGPAEDAVVGFANVTQPVCFPAPPYVRCLNPDTYYFDAHSGPAGESPRGTVVFSTGERAGLRQDHGSVTCLAVNGRNASIGVNFSGLDFENVPHAAVVFVEDNGGAGQDRVGVQDLPTGSSAPSVCPTSPPAGVSLGPTYTVNFPEENMTVTDALATKAQCRRGGWITFGFSSHAACNAFVLERARQACIFERVAHGIVAFRDKYGIGPQHQLAMWACVHGRIGF
jgi:hypothetical protein